jgi:uncharacterized damage-inducible protein DinB
MKFIDSFYYQSLKPEIDSIPGPGHLSEHFASTIKFIGGIAPAKARYAYAQNKWTVTEVIGHFTDAQLVFLGRILFFARGQAAVMPGFDEDKWVPAAKHGDLGLPDVLDLYRKTSALTEALIRSLPEGALQAEGVANGLQIRVEEILVYVMAHEKHHLQVLRDKYLK